MEYFARSNKRRMELRLHYLGVERGGSPVLAIKPGDEFEHQP